MEFKDKVILITGAGKGAGKALAEALAARGAKLALNDISPINVEAVAAGIVQRGGLAKVFVEDVAKKVAVQAMVNNLEDEFGQVDVLINHANVQPKSALIEMDEWDWHRVYDVNVTGAFLVTQSVARLMRVKGGGVILNLVEEPGRGAEKEAAYYSSLASLTKISEVAAQELNPLGIRVASIERSADLVANALKFLEQA
ncbi:MAG: SDR family NAD(P)-dependent oxidoreductase [Anaerolineales bacterium]|nr:SDR family NAD(P)-dependent oxidoreductase [Anaerolineales bacterium]